MSRNPAGQRIGSGGVIHFPIKQPIDYAAVKSTAQPPLVALVTRVWFICMCLALMGYAVMGKGFAYIGLPPFFVGEFMMLSGLACLMICGPWWRFLKMPQMIALLALFAWGTCRTLPYIKSAGLDAVKDAIIWLYGIFTFAVAGVIVCQPKLLVEMVGWYRKYFVKVFLIATPFLWLTFQRFPDSLPSWPWADVTILFLKAGDLQVHLGGVLAFWASEVAGGTAIIWFIPMFINAALLGPVNRGGMVAFLSSIGTSLIFRPFNRWAWGFIGIAFFGLSLLFITGLEIKIPGTERPISFDQLVQNFISVGTSSGETGDLQGTKEWRLTLWNNILNDTLHGQYFWSGLGFGENIVSHYNMQIDPDEAVRDPHNGHISILARAGVPGIVLWAMVHFGWALGMIDGYVRSRHAGRTKWAGLFMWVLVYWLMVVINCSFDPYIEGPMGGVWLWSIYGVGIAAMWLRGKEPELFDQLDRAEEPEPDALAEMGAA